MSIRNGGDGPVLGSGKRIVARSKLVRLLACLLVLLASGVQTSCGPEARDSEPVVGTQSQPLIQPFTISFTLPSGVELTTMAAAAKSSLNARDRTQIEGPLGVSSGSLSVNNDAHVRALTAGGNITIGDRTVVTGNVRASGLATRSPTAVVNGTLQSNVNLGTPRTIQWTFQADNVSSGDVNLEPDQTRDLLPGSYGTLNVKSRAKVILHTGVYRFGRIMVEPQGKLLIDSVSGPVQAYFTVGLTFRGAIESARFGQPQLLLGDMGTETVFIEAPFNAVLIAPNADVRLQAALPQGHRAVFYGKTLTMEPDTIVRVLSFDWGGVDPHLQPPPDPTRPISTMPRSPADIPVSVDSGGNGKPTSSGDSPTSIGFNLPMSYPVAGGEICNSTVTFRFRQGSGRLVSCTYRGGSTTASPATEEELNRGRTLLFQSCSDGQPATAQRQATHFELDVTPCTGFAVTVNSPVVNDKKCSEQLPLLTVDQTRQMRQSFTWTGKQRLATTNPNGTPALYYGWVFVKNKDEALALKKLRIHVLSRPLFADELSQFSGKCGAITNPGDGVGTFVPVVIPGGIYNKLIDVLDPNITPDIQGDRVIFDAVIIRQVPAASRNANGSIRADQLVNSGFRYLHYEADPLADFHTMQLDGGAAKVLIGAVDFVAEAAVDVVEFVTQGLALLSRLLLGTINVDLNIWIGNNDEHFVGPVMQRGWGAFAGLPLGAPGLQVTIIQPFLAVLPIPATSMGNTNMLGHVNIDAFNGLGAGLCVETKNDGAMVTDFIFANEICDFRGFIDTNSPFWDMTSDKRLDLQTFDARLAGMYQAADVYEWDKAVVGFAPKRARILSGYFADTFSSHDDDGLARLYTPCFNFGNSVSDVLVGAAFGVGGVLSALVPGGQLIAAVESAVATVYANSDIVMGLNSHLRASREVMSHEYGHYTFCALLTDSNEFADDYLIWSTIAIGDDTSKGVRYLNEAFADFITANVAGGADYRWLNDFAPVASGSDYPRYCFSAGPDTSPTCWDQNLRGPVSTTDKKDLSGIGRVATLLMDAFDGHANARGTNLPGNGDVWRQSSATDTRLVLSSTNYLAEDDGVLERVHLPGGVLPFFAQEIADDLPPVVIAGQAEIEDPRIYRAVNRAMRTLSGSSNYNWCERCRVLALHSPTRANGDPDTVVNLIQHCLNDSMIGTALQEAPPASNGNFNYDTCQPCPAGTGADGSGGCGLCPADVTLDGATMSAINHFDPTAIQAPNDSCPGVFVVQVNNPQGIFPRNIANITGTVGPVQPLTGTQAQRQAQCQRSLQLTTALQTATGFVSEPVITGGGTFCNACIPQCNSLPHRTFLPADVPGNNALRFSVTATDPTIRLDVNGEIIIP